MEGHDLFEGEVDVVVCDGFTGNVILKTSESAAHAIGKWLKRELTKNPIRILGSLLLSGGLRALKKKTSQKTYGGAPLLGVNGICIIGHGSSDATATKNGILQAAQRRETPFERIDPGRRAEVHPPRRDRAMSKKIYAAIAGTGHYAPEKVLTNADLEKMVDTTDEWIVTRTGIRERHIAAEGELTSDMGTPGRPPRAGKRRRRAGGRGRHLRGHLHARHDFPQHGLPDPGRARRQARLRVRPFLRLRRVPDGAGDRGGRH